MEPTVAGAIFVFFGLVCCAIAAMRRHREVNALIWLGIGSAMYGTTNLVHAFTLMRILSTTFERFAPFVVVFFTYFLNVAAFLAWSELSLGKLRRFLRLMIVPAIAIGLAGVALFVATGSSDKLIPYNNLLTASIVILLAVIVSSPSFPASIWSFQARCFVVAVLLFVGEALFNNVARIYRGSSFQVWHVMDDLGFTAFLFSLAYVAGRRMIANERRLVSRDNELDMARQIQASVLPRSFPKMRHLDIAAA